MTVFETAVGEGDLPPLISVVIPVWNGERWVTEAVESAVFAHEAVEVVIVEDGSTDGSLAVCEEMADRYAQVRVHRHPGGANRGAGASRNLGIRRSRGKYIAFLDADDWYLPNRFDTDVPMLEADPELDGVYGAVARKCEEGHVPLPSGGRDIVTVDEEILPEDLFEALALRGRGSFHTAGITVRREAFDRAGFFPEDLPLAQDLAMWLRLAATCTLVGGSIVEPIAVYRRHGDNRSTSRNPYWPIAARWCYLTTLRWAEQKPLAPEQLLALRHALCTHVVRGMPWQRRRGLRVLTGGLREFVVCTVAHPCLIPVLVARAAGKVRRLISRAWRREAGEGGASP
jgi:hypothetical protein